MQDAIAYLASISLGLYAGALLTEGTILVPYWRRMDPPDFFRLHHQVGPSLFRYFAPITGLAVAFAVLALGVDILSGSVSALRLIASAGAVFGLSTFALYFRKANQSFATHALSDSQLAPELRRWAYWHWARTLAIVIAFMASAAALLEKVQQ